MRERIYADQTLSIYYTMDENPVDVKRWTQLENVRSYYAFFKKYAGEFE